jgi:type IV pilus assembly protein PilF
MAATPAIAAGDSATTAADPLALVRGQLDAGNLDAALVGLKSALREDVVDQAALLLMAEVFLARFDAAAAEATLRRALDARTPRGRVLAPLAKALILQGRPDEVLAELEPTADLSAADRARLLAQHAAAQMALGRHAQAAALVADALAASDDVPEPLLARAALAAGEGDLEAARRDLQAAAALARRDDEAWLMLGQLALGSGDRGRLHRRHRARTHPLAQRPHPRPAAAGGRGSGRCGGGPGPGGGAVPGLLRAGLRPGAAGPGAGPAAGGRRGPGALPGRCAERRRCALLRRLGGPPARQPRAGTGLPGPARGRGGRQPPAAVAGGAHPAARCRRR